jgi:hypothetical protein
LRWLRWSNDGGGSRSDRSLVDQFDTLSRANAENFIYGGYAALFAEKLASPMDRHDVMRQAAADSTYLKLAFSSDLGGGKPPYR